MPMMQGMLKHKKSRHKRSKATTEPVGDLSLPPINYKKRSRELSVSKDRIKKLRRRLLSLDP
jgi:hypothetical protein